MDKLQKTLENMSVEEKALLVNLLMKERYSSTPLASNITLVGLSKSYNKNTNMLLDSLIWKFYGLHYKDYLDVIGPYIGIDPMRFEIALDRRIRYFMEYLYEEGIQSVYKFTE